MYVILVGEVGAMTTAAGEERAGWNVTVFDVYADVGDDPFEEGAGGVRSVIALTEGLACMLLMI